MNDITSFFVIFADKIKEILRLCEKNYMYPLKTLCYNMTIDTWKGKSVGSVVEKNEIIVTQEDKTKRRSKT